MPHIKKLVLHGFKSFAKQTEIVFDAGLNTIIGPNGSGKSNLSDAICFVLGRLSIKSIRAAKAANLIYNGGKNYKPASEARVDLVLDNSDKTFVAGEEVVISRIVRRDGQSIYKINDKTKTRQEVLDLLAQASIDPYGFNIMLQGEISRFVEMRPDERRGVIEEIAGISIYEVRKEKSLRELEKTDSRLKEIGTILHERTAYLKNLDKERADALKYKDIENAIKRDKASLLAKSKKEKETEKKRFDGEVEEKTSSIERIRNQINKLKEEFRGINNEAEEINKKIQESTGLQQETLHKNITEIRAETAGLSVRLENYKQQLSELNERTKQLEENIKKEKEALKELKGRSPEQDKISRLLKQKASAFEKIEKEQEDIYKLRTSLTECRTHLEIIKKRESELLRQIASIKEKTETLRSKIEHSEEETEKLENFSGKISRLNAELVELDKKHLEFLEEAPKYKKEIEIIEKLRKHINEMEICPTCGRKATKEHKEYVNKKSAKELENLRNISKKHESEISEIRERISNIKKEVDDLQEDHNKLHLSKLSIGQLKEKEEIMNGLEDERNSLLGEISRLEKRQKELEINIKRYQEVEENYKKIKQELDELNEKEKSVANIPLDIRMKEQDIERMQLIIKRGGKEKEGLEENITLNESELHEKEKVLKEKEKQDKQLYLTFNNLFTKRNKLQDKSRQLEIGIVDKQNKLRGIEDTVNVIKITLAEINAKISTLDSELLDFPYVKIVELPRKDLEARIKRNEETLIRIGSVNMRALEVYESVKEEYDKIAEKVAKLEEEKSEILRIVVEIEKKKRGVFMKTLRSINELFSRNFMKLSTKGQVWLELENKEDPFSAGLNMIIKIAKGKYMDASSLSGGEQVLVALSLIFAIQEYKPYCFYILDEIDATLDKRNSERLAEILDTYVKSAQYIIISHNDAVISSANTLYGVSMQDGVSKIVSLKL